MLGNGTVPPHDKFAAVRISRAVARRRHVRCAFRQAPTQETGWNLQQHGQRGQSEPAIGFLRPR
jgi:hypothetical protein